MLIMLSETAAEVNGTSYFPLLDRIADGTFAELSTEKELFDKFIGLLSSEGHIRDPESLSSFEFAMALRVAAPRIEAHYQYFNTSIKPSMMTAQDPACPVWVHFDSKQYCSPSLERAQQTLDMEDSMEVLPFDRLLGQDGDGAPSILYADITHPLFAQFHETISKTAKDGRTSYRLRYRPSVLGTDRPLYVSGYGVELVLKRTDYIVIDDREALKAEGGTGDSSAEQNLQDGVAAELKPLTTSELSSLGLNTASYIMSSADPFDTILRVSADFPKYTSLLAAHNATEEFLAEYRANRAVFLPHGYNILWINGVQIDSRQINPFSLLDHLKRERAMIQQLRSVGLSGSEAIDLLSHSEIAQAQVNHEPQRYDWRDDTEGGKVIMWLNDIEKDKRYDGWPTNLRALLQRTYPGQLPSVRRDIHNLIIPVDFADHKELETIVETIQSLIRRTVPVRFGLVPIFPTSESVNQAKVAYHILDTYGLSTLFSYFTTRLAPKAFSGNAGNSFATTVKDRKSRGDGVLLTYKDVLDSSELGRRLDSVRQYLGRLALDGGSPPVLMNGAALPHDENWLEAMSTRVTLDLRAIQHGVMEETLPQDTWVPHYFLFQALTRRNALIVPEDLTSVEVLDVPKLVQSHLEVLHGLPSFHAATDAPHDLWAHIFLVADIDSDLGRELLSGVIAAHSNHPETEVLVLHNPRSHDPTVGLSFRLCDLSQTGEEISSEFMVSSMSEQSSDQVSEDMAQRAADYWRNRQCVADDMGLAPGKAGLWVNGRLIKLGQSTSFSAADIESLLNYERSKRITAVTTALTDLNLVDKIKGPLSLAIVTSLVARAHVSDVPEGIFEAPPSIRIDRFKAWNGTYSAIHTSTAEDASIQIIASVDPASEFAQPWLPILKTLSKLQGIDLSIFLNPRQTLTELPVKRFYRQVINSSPVFQKDGSLKVPQASFTGVPGDALLNLGMDVPPSWLVAPKECSYDLDNIKMNSLPLGHNIDAIYELEHILIDGHSRDVTNGPPPRGVQLLLGTEREPHFADTIIMANLGYFQFKANPGFWRIALHPGRSSKIFTIDSVGSKGYAAQPGDETTSVALLSFQGKTLFPRLSRNPAMESEDVLESGGKLGAAMDYLNRGASFASSALSSVGIHKSSSGANADINIFSVASGHLYERMLSIMILSVMKNTRHSVKFWFIEQFLSPSFKSFLPHLSAHYGFQYEMVTYKWPHWLRSQKEKQREIWGYKILFLDVLFPVSLDKVIFVDADQIVRTDMMELNKVDLHGAPYGFTPMCDSRSEMEGFRFWKQGYWKNFLTGKPYHISALYVVDLKKFRALAAGDRLRQQYHTLSADPASLSNLDQDLPNHMQHNLPIFSLPQEWLWCETWCSDDSLAKAKTIDLCNNPLTKEPKLDRARRQVPEWTAYDEEIAELAQRVGEMSQARNDADRDPRIPGRIKDEL